MIMIENCLVYILYEFVNLLNVLVVQREDGNRQFEIFVMFTKGWIIYTHTYVSLFWIVGLCFKHKCEWL